MRKRPKAKQYVLHVFTKCIQVNYFECMSFLLHSQPLHLNVNGMKTLIFHDRACSGLQRYVLDLFPFETLLCDERWWKEGRKEGRKEPFAFEGRHFFLIFDLSLIFNRNSYKAKRIPRYSKLCPFFLSSLFYLILSLQDLQDLHVQELLLLGTSDVAGWLRSPWPFHLAEELCSPGPRCAGIWVTWHQGIPRCSCNVWPGRFIVRFTLNEHVHVHVDS